MVERDPQGETPAIEQQERFWSAWLDQNRGSDNDQFCKRVEATALECARRIQPGTILEVGCGRGWLSGALSSVAKVTGTDLSASAIALAAGAFPNCSFLAGDFAKLELPGSYGMIVSCDVIAHVADQRAFAIRCHDLLRPGGTLLLLSQNPVVWTRTSWLARQGEGQLRKWPTVAAVRTYLEAAGFEPPRVSSFMPGGDRGLLRGRKYVQGLLRLVGKRRGDALLERAMIGRELVFEAVRT